MRKDELKQQTLGVPFLQNETAEEYDRRMKKAIQHERSFGQRQDSDIIKKRMDSDLFKGGLR